MPFSSGFRPLAGIMVLILKKEIDNNIKLVGFRPLAGIMVLISLLHDVRGLD